MLETSPLGGIFSHPQSEALHAQEVLMLVSAVLFALSLNAHLPAVPSMVPAETTPVMSVAEAAAVCPVCGKPVAPGEGSKVMVRGQEYAVSDKACGDELVANPDKYLDADGTPKNAKKETKPM
jgi:hypothetical protein